MRMGSVIGAGAVVAADIPPYSLAVGAPAKPVKNRRDLKDLPTQESDVFFGALEQLRGNGQSEGQVTTNRAGN